TVALIAAASLPSDLYYDINVAIDRAPQFQNQLNEVREKYPVHLPNEAKDPLHAANVDAPHHLNLGTVEEKVGGESRRGGTGGAGWGGLVYTGSIDTIWPMFGIANQILAVLALALVTTWLVNAGRGRYTPVTILPMLFVTSTTLTAAVKMVTGRFAQMIDD